MLNISFCSDSLSLRTASLISPLPLQPELCPRGVCGGGEGSFIVAVASTHLVQPPPFSELGPINVASTGPGKDSIVKKKSLYYLET